MSKKQNYLVEIRAGPAIILNFAAPYYSWGSGLLDFNILTFYYRKEVVY